MSRYPKVGCEACMDIPMTSKRFIGTVLDNGLGNRYELCLRDGTPLWIAISISKVNVVNMNILHTVVDNEPMVLNVGRI